MWSSGYLFQISADHIFFCIKKPPIIWRLRKGGFTLIIYDSHFCKVYTKWNKNFSAFFSFASDKPVQILEQDHI